MRCRMGFSGTTVPKKTGPVAAEGKQSVRAMSNDKNQDNPRVADSS